MTTSQAPHITCQRCKRKRTINQSRTKHLPGGSGAAWVCDNEAECLAAARAYLQATIVSALASTLDLYVWPHERTTGPRHECSTTGEHTIHVCECGWIWTSPAMAHTAEPTLPTMPPEPPGPVDWPKATFEFDTASGQPRVRWTDEEGQRHESVKFNGVEVETDAPTSGGPQDPRSRLVAILAHLHDLTVEVKSIMDAPAPYWPESWKEVGYTDDRPEWARGSKVVEPEFPCRLMPTRGCPQAGLPGVCPDLCERFEQDHGARAATWQKDMGIAAEALIVRGPGIVSTVDAPATGKPVDADNDPPDVTVAKIRRNRLALLRTGILPPGKPIEPWCRVCGNYTAAVGALTASASGTPVCADRGACTARLVQDAHALAGWPK